MAGDNPNGKFEPVAMNTSDMCLLTVGDGRSHDLVKLSDAQQDTAAQIKMAQERILSVAQRLSAYYPDGAHGLLNDIKKGPAHDVIAAALKPSSTNIV